MKNSPGDHDFVSRVNMYLDNELSSEAQEQFLKDVNSNPSFSKIFEKEKSFKQLLQNNIARKSVSPDLIQRIKDKINPSFR